MPLTATVSNGPPAIHIHWPEDNSAQFFTVKRRDPAQVQWEVVATLPGSAEGYLDTDVQIGERYEYTIVKSDPMYTTDTVCVPPGSEITFTINDTEGNGLCCWNSNGYWQLFACGQLIAQGAEYTYTDQHQFTMCGSGTCNEVVVRIYPDHQFQEISWELETSDGSVLAAGSPQMAPMFGYILAGIEVPAEEAHGGILVLVDEEFADPLAAELDRLKKDLIGEGWMAQQEVVPAGSTPVAVKTTIMQYYNAMPDLRALLLIGHVPVPYSGLIAPDEHPEHLGAWPADLYYAEMDGPWTDEVVNWNVWSVPSRNHNIVGDGKFDQSVLPSDVDLILGRVDFDGLNVFAQDGTELLRSYLDRNHAFRTGQLTYQRKAVVNENFSWLDHESAIYRSCIPMFGATDVYDGPFIGTLSTEGHLWSMAGGPGMPDAAQGVGTSAQIAATQLNGAFAHLLGSFFGDWDQPNNFMRTVLGSGMLGVVWGLQEMMFHHMALGAPIGESVRRSQNASYFTHERNGRLVHMALMGDPTLQLFHVPPVIDAEAMAQMNGVALTWSAIQGPVEGYHIFRRSSQDQNFTRITDEPVIGTSYLDDDAIPGEHEYLVRALRLESTLSGSYYILGGGTPVPVSINVGSPVYELDDLVIAPSPADGRFTIRSQGIDRLMEVKLFDLAGAVVSASISHHEDLVEVITDVADGIYMLRMTFENGRELRRSIVIAR